MEVLIGVLVAVLINLFSNEVYVLISWFAKKLVGGLAVFLPADLKLRWKEEWLADLNEMPGSFMKLYYALSLVLGLPAFLKEANRVYYTVDSMDKFTSVSGRIVAITGYSREEILQMYGHDLIANPKDRESSKNMLKLKQRGLV
jgi:PAS domain-containing protein